MKTKSEVIKLMKEGTHCIYNDCDEKEEVLKNILDKLIIEYNIVSYSLVPKGYYFISFNKNLIEIILTFIRPIKHEIINTSTIIK